MTGMLGAIHINHTGGWWTVGIVGLGVVGITGIVWLRPTIGAIGAKVKRAVIGIYGALYIIGARRLIDTGDAAVRMHNGDTFAAIIISDTVHSSRITQQDRIKLLKRYILRKRST